MTIRVLVADDSAVMRRLLSEVLASIPDVDVVGTASSGEDAVAKARVLRPDLMTCDIVINEMDGIDTVRALRSAGFTMPIVMVSALSVRGAEALASLAAGADDYVCKPRGTDGAARAREYLRAELRPRVVALASHGRRPLRGLPSTPPSPSPSSPPRSSIPPPRERNVFRPSVAPAAPNGAAAPTASNAAAAPTASNGASPPPSHHPSAPAPEPSVRSTGRAVVPSPSEPPSLVVVGSSTGGPSALHALLAALGRDFVAPILVVQHMPPVFTATLAERLARETNLEVVEARDAMPLTRGRVLVAPGDRHMVVARNVVRLLDAPPENNSRPSVDVLFRSAAELGSGVVALVLTGMGRDGLEGARALKRGGATVLVQSEPTSVVWGMPGHVARAGLADGVLAPAEMGETLRRWSRSPRVGRERR